MKAAVIRSYGSFEALEIQEVPIPDPDKGEVLVEVYGSSLNPIDIGMRSGKTRFFAWNRLPMVLGVDLAGVVLRTGPGVTAFAPGDRVYGLVNPLTQGAHAEYCTVPVNHIAHMPETISFRKAGIIPLAALTALQALRDAGRLKTGQRVLINGCTGGVGSFAVQIARHFGAEVIGICSRANAELAQDLGAHEVIEYDTGSSHTISGKFHIILDLVGNIARREFIRQLNEEGRYITPVINWSVFSKIPLWAVMRRPVYRIVMVKPQTQDLEYIRELVESDIVQPYFEMIYPLQYIQAGHKRLEDGGVRGKLVLELKEFEELL